MAQEYVIIKDGGKQYTLSPGQTIDLEKKDGVKGTEVIFPEVIYYKSSEGKVEIGNPLVKGLKVKGTIVISEVKGPKLIVFKFRRRKDSRTKNGHRQKYTRILIKEIVKE